MQLRGKSQDIPTYLTRYFIEPNSKGKVYASMLVQFQAEESESIGEINWLVQNGWNGPTEKQVSLSFQNDGIYFQQADADIWGFEAETYVDLSNTLRLTMFADYIRAEIEDDNLPRTPPMRFGSELSYANDGLSADVGFTWYDTQTDVASFETATDGYTLVNASVQYEFGGQGVDWIVFARGDNLTDEEARVHTSFLKDQAPLPGRNFTVGVRAMF